MGKEKKVNPQKEAKEERHWRNISILTGFWHKIFWRQGIPQRPRKKDGGEGKEGKKRGASQKFDLEGASQEQKKGLLLGLGGQSLSLLPQLQLDGLLKPRPAGTDYSGSGPDPQARLSLQVGATTN